MKSFLIALCLFGASWLPSSVLADLNSLTQVELVDSGSDSTKLNFLFANTPSKPRIFSLENPRRLILDFSDTLKDVRENYLPFGVGLVKGVRLAEAGNRTRAVVALVNSAHYETKVTGNSLVLSLVSKRLAAPSADKDKKEVKALAPSITNVDFRRGDKGQGLVLVSLSDANIVVDLNIDRQQIVLDLQDADVPESLERLLDVLDFATPVRTIDTLKVGDNARVVITIKGEFAQVSYQADNLFTVEISVPEADDDNVQTIVSKDDIYVGEKLSLNFQNIEIRTILQIIADFTGLNIVVSDTVTGSLTLRLKQVPWDQALDIILKTQGLAMRRKENVVLVAPSEEIASREKLELESEKQIQELSPLVTKVIQLKYADAEVIAGMLKDSASSGEDANAADELTATTTTENVAVEGGFLSQRGAIGFVTRTNSLIIQDTEARVEQIVGLLAEIDIAVRQVMVESRIVIATNDFSKDIGVQFGISHQGPAVNGGARTVVGGKVGSGTTFTNALDEQVTPGFTVNGAEQFLVSLPAAGATSGIGLALLSANQYLLSLELTAQQLEGNAEVVASPRLITADRVLASIEQGIEIPYQKTEGTGASATTSVEFKEALLKLEVTPQITPDDNVIMDISIQKDDPIASISPSGEPALQQRAIKSQVLVGHDETVILGGVYERTLTHELRKVPFFGDLPLVGALFRRTLDSDSKSELLIFLTPKIIDKIRSAGR